MNTFRELPVQRGLRLSVASAIMLAAVVSTAAGVPPRWAVNPAVPGAQRLFNPGAVRLLDGPFKTMQDVDHAYLMRLEPDRLLAQFRVEAGLEPLLVLINNQQFTKTANCWGVANNEKGTNTNRVVVFRKPGCIECSL